ncbi:hypothetical protein ACFVYJ_06505 [Pontibacter sp. JAM-7]|uniref:hypothetical protein n=1 Tax=Pontibacter sp. JAM-7 TaxID=3366581 RepID=UPI003AF482B7
MKYIAYRRLSGAEAFDSKATMFAAISDAPEGDYFLKVFQVEIQHDQLFAQLMASFPHLFSTMMSWEMNHRDWYTSFEVHSSRALNRTIQLMFDSFNVNVLTLISFSGHIRVVNERPLGRISDFPTQQVVYSAAFPRLPEQPDSNAPSKQLQMRLYTLRRDIHADDSQVSIPNEILTRLNTKTKVELINMIRLGSFELDQLKRLLNEHQSRPISEQDIAALFQWLQQSASVLSTATKEHKNGR